ncbi:hypothetical protein Pnap_2113 [Polaromonas naphthalenivorans CJ2]|uniref:Uncharacterized protein n=1 Tax=Polaromonas naphthalenivorans (strain CJ2) TaxID=365044 RepID=A1VP44_POLNA|nr:hypothetical protein Pnap_2113 [Polaromonas naphthalenivorans CJ2]
MTMHRHRKKLCVFGMQGDAARKPCHKAIKPRLLTNPRIAHTDALDAATHRRIDQFSCCLSLFPCEKEPLATASTQGWRVGSALKATGKAAHQQGLFFYSWVDSEIKWPGYQRPF